MAGVVVSEFAISVVTVIILEPAFTVVVVVDPPLVVVPLYCDGQEFSLPLLLLLKNPGS